MEKEKLSVLKKIDSRQLYRLFVDGRLYAKENGWLRYEQRQPGCVQGISLAFCHMIDNFELEDGITLTYLSKLHDLLFSKIDVKSRKNRYPGQIREFRISFLVRKRASSRNGIRELMADRTLKDAFKGDINACQNAEDIYNAISAGDKIRYIVETGYLPPLLNQASVNKEPQHLYLQARKQVRRNITAKTQAILDHYNQTIDTIDNDLKLLFIVDCVKELERLHPFVDGNTRVFVSILFNHLLMLNGFYPVIFEEPSIFDARTSEEIMTEVYQGQEIVRRIIQDPSIRVFGHSIDDESAENQKGACSLMQELIERIDLL